jgi:hypothetical protein
MGALNSSTSSYNTAIGYGAGSGLTSGSKNTFIGYNAGMNYSSQTGNFYNNTGTNSLFIGYDVRPNSYNDDNEVVISGYAGGSYGTIGQGSNTTTIGNANTTYSVIYGSTGLSNLPASSGNTNGGDFILKAQNGYSGSNTNGGNLILTPGSKGGTGTTGIVQVNGQIKITGGAPDAGKVLTSDANGVATWQNSGGSVATMSATGTATSTATYIIFTGSTASQTITIPSAVTMGSGREITIKNVASVSVSIASAGGYLIQDNSTLTSASAALGIEPSNNWMKLVSDGTNWYIFRALF